MSVVKNHNRESNATRVAVTGGKHVVKNMLKTLSRTPNPLGVIRLMKPILHAKG